MSSEDSWGEVVLPKGDAENNSSTAPPVNIKTSAELQTNSEELESVIILCLNELKLAHETRYEDEKAIKTAALFLKAQFLLANFIKDVELRAKQMKREVKRVEGEKYFYYKDLEPGKKMTEVALGHLINRDVDVIGSSSITSEAEAEAKRLEYIFGTLKDGHVFFRNIGKGKSPWSE